MSQKIDWFHHAQDAAAGFREVAKTLREAEEMLGNKGNRSSLFEVREARMDAEGMADRLERIVWKATHANA